MKTSYSFVHLSSKFLSIGFLVWKLKGGQINPPLGVTGSTNSEGEVGLSFIAFFPIHSVKQYQCPLLFNTSFV